MDTQPVTPVRKAIPRWPMIVALLLFLLVLLPLILGAVDFTRMRNGRRPALSVMIGSRIIGHGPENSGLEDATTDYIGWGYGLRYNRRGSRLAAPNAKIVFWFLLQREGKVLRSDGCFPAKGVPDSITFPDYHPSEM